jgi:hypothetical protein
MKSCKNNSVSSQMWGSTVVRSGCSDAVLFSRFSFCNAILNQNVKEVVTVYLRMRMSSVVFVHPKNNLQETEARAEFVVGYYVAKYSKQIHV